MSVYWKAVQERLREGPKPRLELVRELCPKAMSKRKLQSTLNELEEKGLVLCIPKREKGSKRWISWYALPEHQYLMEVDEGRVVDAVERLKLKLLRYPTAEEIASEADIPRAAAEDMAFRTAPRTGWQPPSQQEIDESVERLKIILFQAAMKTQHPEYKITYIEKGDVERVEYFLKEHPNLVPEITYYGPKRRTECIWPEDAKRILMKGKVKGI